MPSFPYVPGNKSTYFINPESGRAPFLTPITKKTRCLARVQWIHNKYYQTSTSNCEEFLQDIAIKNISFDEEESIQYTVIVMSISGSIQGNSVIAEPLLVATN